MFPHGSGRFTSDLDKSRRFHEGSNSLVPIMFQDQGTLLDSIGSSRTAKKVAVLKSTCSLNHPAFNSNMTHMEATVEIEECVCLVVQDGSYWDLSPV